jgi:parvulin-like peptidyl-prolyl isomerase
MSRSPRVVSGKKMFHTSSILVVTGLLSVAGNAWSQAPARPAASPRAAATPAARTAQATPAAAPAAPAATPAPAAGQAAAEAPKLEIMAVVNGENITRKALAQQCLERYGETVLESLVNKHLILEACAQRNIRITKQDIEDEIQRIAARWNLPVERWLAMLQMERNITPEQYRRDIIWPTLALKHLAADKLAVSDAALKKEMESEYGPKVRVRMIAVSKKDLAQKLAAELKAKPDTFDAAAKQYSEDPNSAAARGLIPPIRRHIGDPSIEKTVFAMKPNQVSDVIPVAGQYLIFKCEKHLPPTHISPQYQQTAEDQLKERIVERNLREASSQLFQELQSKATVVNVYNDLEKRKQQPNVAATINGKPITIEQLAEECMARHGIGVLDTEVNRVLLTQALAKKKSQVTNADLDAEVARAAEAYGFMNPKNQPDIARWLQEMTEREGMSVETYMRDAVWPSVALKKLVSADVKVSEDDLQKGFVANYGERVEVLALVLGNQRTAQEVWDMARSNLTPQFFGELASQYSIEPVSRANMGEVPPIQKFSGQPKVEEEAFALTKEDPLSAIIAIADKYIVLYYLGRTEPIVQKMEDVRDELTKDIHEKKLRVAMTQQFDRLKEVAQIDNYLSGSSSDGATPQAAGNEAAVEAADVSAAPAPTLVRPASSRKR